MLNKQGQEVNESTLPNIRPHGVYVDGKAFTSLGPGSVAAGKSFIEAIQTTVDRINNSAASIRKWIEQSVIELRAIGVSQEGAQEVVSFALTTTQPNETLTAIKGAIAAGRQVDVSQGYVRLMDALRGPKQEPRKAARPNRRNRRKAKGRK